MVLGQGSVVVVVVVINATYLSLSLLNRTKESKLQPSTTETAPQLVIVVITDYVPTYLIDRNLQTNIFTLSTARTNLTVNLVQGLQNELHKCTLPSTRWWLLLERPCVRMVVCVTPKF